MILKHLMKDGRIDFLDRIIEAPKKFTISSAGANPFTIQLHTSGESIASSGTTIQAATITYTQVVKVHQAVMIYPNGTDVPAVVMYPDRAHSDGIYAAGRRCTLPVGWLVC